MVKEVCPIFSLIFARMYIDVLGISAKYQWYHCLFSLAHALDKLNNYKEQYYRKISSHTGPYRFWSLHSVFITILRWLAGSGTSILDTTLGRIDASRLVETIP